MKTLEKQPLESPRLTYTKTILDKVSFDSQIFNKELGKSKNYLSKDELHKLKTWCSDRFAISSNKLEHLLICA